MFRPQLLHLKDWHGLITATILLDSVHDFLICLDKIYLRSKKCYDNDFPRVQLGTPDSLVASALLSLSQHRRDYWNGILALKCVPIFDREHTYPGSFKTPLKPRSPWTFVHLSTSSGCNWGERKTRSGENSIYFSYYFLFPRKQSLTAVF